MPAAVDLLVASGLGPVWVSGVCLEDGPQGEGESEEVEGEAEYGLGDEATAEVPELEEEEEHVGDEVGHRECVCDAFVERVRPEVHARHIRVPRGQEPAAQDDVDEPEV
eukprot:CAMPEP_0173465724 /NCGR_PEP_ID=MMETSP1357-20121228/72135_1 /TAXON_ID=77926 /ORGANISM="Hemiselmis rufescens, Strain PCC563" /LENGTH=108 /DNA_ID=CAMNT_0014433723 /DNA_START=40 /DNA_END=362 /DNA_ORIENTATION=-